VGLPLLEAMRAGPARAAGNPAGLVSAAHGNRPKRMVVYFVPNGTLKALWWPGAGATETDFTLGPLLRGRDATAASDPSRSLEPHKKDLVLFQGLDNRATVSGFRCTHNDAATLTTGWGLAGANIGSAIAQGISIDQAVGRLIDEVAPLKATTVQLGISNGGPPTRLAHLGPARPLPNVDQPATLFARLFGDPRLDAATLDKQWQRRRSLLDDLKADYLAVLPRVSGEDRARLEAHLDGLRTVEKRVSLTTSCRPANPAYPRYETYGPTLPDAARAFIDTLALGMACDTTRAATIQLRPAGGGASYFPWLGLSTVYADGEHHELTHDPNNAQKREKLTSIYTWFTEVLAYLVQKLKTTPDGAGSLFDTSTVLQISECSDGAAHSKTNLPLLLVGGLGGALRTGRFLTYDKRSHNDLLLSLLQGFGSDATCFGDPKLCSGPLSGLRS
jgi:hypothetical protein